jgi:hypothetical protein
VAIGLLSGSRGTRPDVRAQAIKQPGAGAQHHRHEVEADLVEQRGIEELAGNVRTAVHEHVL